MEERSLFESFLKTAVEGIRDEKKRQEIKEELQDHLYEKFEDFLRRGYTEEEAEQKAVEEMGDVKNLSEEMSRVHSIVPHVYYHRTVLVLLFGLLFSHFNLTIEGFNFFPQIVGIILVTIALFRFYSLSKRTKVAFWLYTLSVVAERILGLFVGELPNEVFIIATAYGVIEFVTTMTLVFSSLRELDKGHKGLSWVIGIEWLNIPVLLLSFLGDVVLPFIIMMILLAVELILLGRFARRAGKVDWKERRGLHISVPIVLAIVYGICCLIPPIVEMRLTSFRPEGVRYEKKREVFSFNNYTTIEEMIEVENKWGIPYASVNYVQKFMTEEDFTLLSSFENRKLRAEYYDDTGAAYSILGYSEERDEFCFVEFFLFTEKVEGYVCRADLLVKGYEGVGHFFYGDVHSEEVTAYEGEIFYALRGRESFGYFIASGEGKPLGQDTFFTLERHSFDLRDLTKTEFESGWSVWTQYG